MTFRALVKYGLTFVDTAHLHSVKLYLWMPAFWAFLINSRPCSTAILWFFVIDSFQEPRRHGALSRFCYNLSLWQIVICTCKTTAFTSDGVGFWQLNQVATGWTEACRRRRISSKVLNNSLPPISAMALIFYDEGRGWRVGAAGRRRGFMCGGGPFATKSAG